MIEYKGYQIKPHSLIPTSYVVATSGQGGKIPNVLDGLFTSPTIAKSVIDDYVAKKEETNAKTNRQTRS